MKKIITFHLECSVCKNRNYKVKRAKESRAAKLAISKYCKFCQIHTQHNEVR